MYQVLTHRDGPVCATYTQQTAQDAVASLRVLSGGQAWCIPSTPQAVAARDLEVLTGLEDTLISEVVRVTIIGERVEVLTRKTLRGLIRLRGHADGQGGATAEAPTQAQAERLARAALARVGEPEVPFDLLELLPDT